MLNRKLELEVVEASTTGNIRVIDEPYIIKYPVSPRPIRNLALAILFAGFFIVDVHLFREYFFKRLVSPSDLSEFENYAPVLGVVPNADENETSFVESFRNIITNFQLNDLNNQSIFNFWTNIRYWKKLYFLSLCKNFIQAWQKSPFS